MRQDALRIVRQSRQYQKLLISPRCIVREVGRVHGLSSNLVMSSKVLLSADVSWLASSRSMLRKYAIFVTLGIVSVNLECYKL
jgi:hypothetical protein